MICPGISATTVWVDDVRRGKQAATAAAFAKVCALDSFAFLHLRYVDLTAWFPGSRQGQLARAALGEIFAKSGEG